MTPSLKILIVDDEPMILRTSVRARTIRRLEKPADLARLAQVPAGIEFDQ